MGEQYSCCVSRQRPFIQTQYITIRFGPQIPEVIPPERITNFCFSRKAPIHQDEVQGMFRVSFITLNQPTLLENAETRTSQISVSHEGSQIFNNDIQIITIATNYLQQMNRMGIEMIRVYEPREFDVISRRTLFKCFAHVISHFDARVDLINLKLRVINFYWDKDQVHRFYAWNQDFIEVDRLLMRVQH